MSVLHEENGKRVALWNGKLCLFFLVYEDQEKTAWAMQGSDKIYWQTKHNA